MGFELRREVVGLLPRNGVLTDKECRLILELADNCGEKTREGWPGVDWLAVAADIPNPRRVGEFFASIARKWFELRVELGKDKHGKPYYSKPGKRTTYRIPTREDLLASCPDKVPPLPGPYPAKAPPTGGPKVPATEGPKVPPTPGARSPQQRDPFPQGFPQEDPQEPPSPPAGYADPDDIVEGEIVEEGEGDASQLQNQINTLIAEAQTLRPTWKTKTADLRTHITAALPMLDNNLDAVGALVRATAGDPNTAHPSRLTASGSPHLQNARQALLFAHMDSADAANDPEPGTHPYEPGPHDRCTVCQMPEANVNRHGRRRSTTTQPRTSARNLPANFIPDTRAPGRNYAERL